MADLGWCQLGDGLEAADAVVLFGTATKQIYHRLGYLATFMCQPAIPSFCGSGWHLHMSLPNRDTRENVFTPTDETAPLSPVGSHFVAGVLERAAAASVSTTPTVNGYRRRRTFSLAPDRATWASTTGRP